MNLARRMKNIQRLECIPNQPYAATKLGLKIQLFGSQICFSQDGDCMSLDEARNALIELLDVLSDDYRG